MGEHELDLSVGDVLHVGECTITVIDIDGPHVRFQIDHGDELEPALWGEPQWAMALDRGID